MLLSIIRRVGKQFENAKSLRKYGYLVGELPRIL
jgi:hypothetical protein